MTFKLSRMHSFPVTLISLLFSALLTLSISLSTTAEENSTIFDFVPTTTDPTDGLGVVTDDPGIIEERGNNENSKESLVEEKENRNGLDQNLVQVEQNELDKWEAPFEIQKSFQYYHAGFDEDRRPIWIAEVGHWNFRKVTDEGGELLKSFHKYCDQANRRILKSIEERSTDENPVSEVKFIVDLEHFNLIQMTHLPTVSVILELLNKFRVILNDHLSLAVVLNTNAAAHGLITLVRPVLGNIMQRVEVYGTNKANWLPHVLRDFPKHQIPLWYGGIKDFKPLKVYG